MNLKTMQIVRNLITIFMLLMAQKSFSQITDVDTLFLKKDANYGSRQSVFIEKNKNSRFYRDITKFEFDEFDKQAYQWSLDYLKENKIELTRQKNILPADKWILTKFFNGDFYAYHPCDFYTFYQISITDSAFVELTGEGPVANKILSQKKLNHTTFEIKTTGMIQQNNTIKIYIINQQKGIAVFEQNRDDGSKYNYLMVEAEKIKTLPFIVNRCDINKQFEFDFPEPNFDQLIKSRK